MRSKQHRFNVANEIVRRVDTVTLLKCEEVQEIHERAQTGEFDDFDDFPGDADCYDRSDAAIDFGEA